MRSFRSAVGVVVLFALLLGQETRVLAGTTGVITGTVINADTKVPLADVKVSAISGTGTYNGSTNSHGFYSFTGVSPDTYTVTFSLSGYEPYTAQAVNVFPDQTAYLNVSLVRSAKVIGQVSVRAQAGAYQPKQTQDTYTITPATIDTIQGNALNLSESYLISSLPGAALDSSGYPTIRGGRENNQGFQFEGIPYVDAFTNQFTNTLATPGLGLSQVQLTPGAGNASFGNSGTGTLNLVAKKGTYPGFSDTQFAVGGPNFYHAMNMEYGTASPDGRWSEYFTFAGGTTAYYYGRNRAPAAELLVFGQIKTETDREVVNNFIYKFGKNNAQSLQFFLDNAQHDFIGGFGGNPYCFTTCDPVYLDTQSFYTGLFTPGTTPFNGIGLTPAQIQNMIVFDPYQTYATETLAAANRPPLEYYQPNTAFKIQYDNNISSSTFFSAKAYRTNSIVTFDFPHPFGFVLLQGGFTTGATASLTKQMGEKHLLEVGADYAWLHPVYDQPSNQWGLLSTDFGGGDPITGLGAFESWDFINASSPNPQLSYCPFGGCGYLDQFFAGGQPPRLPNNIEQSVTNRQDYSAYINDTISPSDPLKIDLGIRFDAVNYRMPPPGIDPATCTSLYLPATWTAPPPDPANPLGLGVPGVCPTATFNVTKQETQPRIWEPRAAFAYQLGANNAIRFSYGRSVLFPPLGLIDLVVPTYIYSPFNSIPSSDYLGCAIFGYCNAPGVHAPAVCGIPGYQVSCVNYGDQLRWESQNTIEGVPLQPVKPETFNNFDFSYSHQFPNDLSFKITPWYRKGYDATASVQSPKLGPNGQPIRNPDGSYVFNPPVATNLGSDRAVGIEFLLTKGATYGLSGQFTATYINEFSNVIPLSSSEDFFPTIPPASLALGNLYRVGFLSPFQTSLDLNYRTRNGWRVSPQIQWNIGYPLGSGTLTAAFVDGVPVTIPNTNASTAVNEAPNGSYGYIDPMNPGSFFFPNIAATRGTPEGPSPGAKLSHPDSVTNLTVEFQHPDTRWLYGLTVTNLFNDVYSGATLNGRYQPVATGISGPLTGLSTRLPFYPGLGYANYTPLIHGQEPYIDSPNNFGQTWYFYVQTKL